MSFCDFLSFKVVVVQGCCRLRLLSFKVVVVQGCCRSRIFLLLELLHTVQIRFTAAKPNAKQDVLQWCRIRYAALTKAKRDVLQSCRIRYA